MMTKQFQVYNSAPLLRHPVRLFRAVFRGLAEGYDLALSRFIGHLQAMHKRYFISLMWEVILPLLTAGGFILLRAKSIIVLDSGSIPYPLYALSGVFMWLIFTQAIFSGIFLTRETAKLSATMSVPPEAFWMHAIFHSVFVTVINFSILVAVLFFVFQVSFINVAASFALALLILMILGVGISFLILPLGFIYQDIFKIARLIISIWFVLTPVVYLGAKSGSLQLISQLNPVTPLIHTARYFLIGGEYDVLPALFVSMGVLFSIIPILMCLRATMPHVIERLLS